MENPKIYQAISNVMAEIGAIKKGKKNQQQGFMYRGVDDVMNALQPALVKHKVFIVPTVLVEHREERTTQKGGILFYTRLEIDYKFFAEDGSFIETRVIGEAMDSGDKATNKAMSIAYKYACFQVFCIPTEEMEDPDKQVHEPAPKKKMDPVKQEKTLSGQKVNEVKVGIIRKELDRTGVSEDAICQRYKLKSIEDVTEELFPKIVNALKNTKSK